MLSYLKTKIFNPNKKRPAGTYQGSSKYWEDRYAGGGNSGAGSYGKLAEYKAKILNEFVQRNNIQKVIELGCGDGSQLSLANYKSYIGLDVSKSAIQICNDKFGDDQTKSFFQINPQAFYDNYMNFEAELALSLDVIFHLTEDEVFQNYMNRLFNISNKFVIIYSSNNDHREAPHLLDRKFTNWVDNHAVGWKLIEKIDNEFQYDKKDEINTSRSDFYIYKKKNIQ